MLFNKTNKQVNEIIRIIKEEHDRHQELMHVFMDAAKDCTNVDNRGYSYELVDEERRLMLLCAKMLDRINEEVLDD